VRSTLFELTRKRIQSDLGGLWVHSRSWWEHKPCSGSASSRADSSTDSQSHGRGREAPQEERLEKEGAEENQRCRRQQTSHSSLCGCPFTNERKGKQVSRPGMTEKKCTIEENKTEKNCPSPSQPRLRTCPKVYHPHQCPVMRVLTSTGSPWVCFPSRSHRSNVAPLLVVVVSSSTTRVLSYGPAGAPSCFIKQINPSSMCGLSSS